MDESQGTAARTGSWRRTVQRVLQPGPSPSGLAGIPREFRLRSLTVWRRLVPVRTCTDDLDLAGGGVQVPESCVGVCVWVWVWVCVSVCEIRPVSLTAVLSVAF